MPEYDVESTIDDQLPRKRAPAHMLHAESKQQCPECDAITSIVSEYCPQCAEPLNRGAVDG